jgi:hypothetical protein
VLLFGQHCDRSPDTALHAIAVPRSKIAQLSPYIEKNCKSFLDYVRAVAQAIACILMRMDMYTVYNLIFTVVNNYA